MTITPGYDPKGLAPKILIKDIDDVLQFTYEANQIAASPTQDFAVRSGSLHLGVNDDFGMFTFVIDDVNAVLIDGSAKANPTIKQQWSVELFLGKDSSNLNRWFYGKVMQVKVARPTTNVQQMEVICVGWGVKTKYRTTSIKRFQEKDTDGLELLTTDTSAKVSEYVKDIFEDDDHYIASGLTPESEITVTQVEDIDIKFADFQLTAQTWASAVSTLSAWANAYWGLDADRDVYFWQIGTKDSGFFFTNDLDGLAAQNWDADKIGYLMNGSFDWNDSSAEGALSILHGIGGNSVKLVHDSAVVANGVFDLDATWHAWVINPEENNIAKIALSLNSVGTPASGNATFFILGDDGSNAPNINDIRAVGEVGQSKLVALPSSGTEWKEITFNIKGGVSIQPRERLYIAVRRYGTASHTFSLEYRLSPDADYWTSSTGASWSAVTGAAGVTFLHRVYSNRAINVSLEDLVAKRKYGTREAIFSLRQDNQVETIQEALIQASETLGKERRVYSNIVVSPVTARLPLGKYCRIRDTHSGLDTLADIIGVDLSFSADDVSNVGADSITLTLQEANV